MVRRNNVRTEVRESGVIPHAGKIATVLAAGLGIVFLSIDPPGITAQQPPVAMDDATPRVTLATAPVWLGNSLTAANLYVTHAVHPTEEHASPTEGHIAPPEAPIAEVQPEGASLSEEASDGNISTDPTYSWTLNIKRGDTLMPKLVDAGIPRSQARAAISALGRFYDPRRIRPGQAVTVTFRDTANDPVDEGSRSEDGSATFVGLTVTVDYAKQVAVARTEDGQFSAREVEANLRQELRAVSGTIDNSLFESAEREGVPVPVLINMIKAFSWDVDFQRDIQPGDGFEVMFEQFRNDAGETVHEGRMVYGNLILQGKRKPIYLFTTEDGVEDYFDEEGKAARKALLRTPIDGAKLSSGFGQRRHPILGYNRMHRGIDFAAPNGTPIYAAGDGVVDFAGPNAGYGRYVRIRHNDEFSTAYAHISNFAPGMMRGKRVRQGEVIGYVGSTGESTGPHLHYEILRQNEQVNPLTIKVQAGRILAGRDIKRFAAQRGTISNELAATQQNLHMVADIVD